MKRVLSARCVCANPVSFITVLALLILAACNPAAATAPPATATMPPATEEAIGVTQEPNPFPLAEPGPYDTGTRQFTVEDASRDNRQVGITVWYPALRPQDDSTSLPIRDADPDLSGAPYPLILSSTKVARIFAPYLVTHGFTWASVDRIDFYIPWNSQLIQQPLDILFALDQVASNPPQGLEGMIDAERAGAMGYSFDGYNALALSGARIDPEFYLAQCAAAPAMEPALGSFWINYYCDMSKAWDRFAARAGAAITTSTDGLWQPMTDERIRAVMPMAPEGAWLFGERGLAAVDRPTLIIGATEDVDCDYHREAVYIFEHLGTPDRVMISFVGADHMMVYNSAQVAHMSHFATAFFGYHLQGRADYAEYFAQDFIAQHPDLAWGVVVDQ